MSAKVKKTKKEYPVFEAMLKQEFGPFEKEFMFHPERQWRFDYAYPDQKIAIEIEGLVQPWRKSRHTQNEGYKEDCIKYNAAAELGWRVFRFTQDMTEQVYPIDLLKRVLLLR